MTEQEAIRLICFVYRYFEEYKARGFNLTYILIDYGNYFSIAIKGHDDFTATMTKHYKNSYKSNQLRFRSWEVLAVGGFDGDNLAMYNL